MAPVGWFLQILRFFRENGSARVVTELCVDVVMALPGWAKVEIGRVVSMIRLEYSLEVKEIGLREMGSIRVSH
jgi:hypothetical protein